MYADDVIHVTKQILRSLEPHLPAIAVFAVVYFVLSRLGLTRSIIWGLLAPVVFAMIADYLAQQREGRACE